LTGLRLRIGSRGSQLALWQANHVAERLGRLGHEVAIEVIHTSGDRITHVALAEVGTKGMFTKEIEEALLLARIDLAVHSLKDLPTELSQEFDIAAILDREDPRDALCSKHYASLNQLPEGARVGTSSLRREAQLKVMRPDLAVAPVRGNVDTRLRKLESGEYDALILAYAGLRRLARTELVREIIAVDLICPAAGQGALALEIRAGDGLVRAAVEPLDDPRARSETTCERALLAALGGGCQVPIGASASWHAGSLALEAVVANPAATILLRESVTGTDPMTVGRIAAENLLRRGGRAVLDQVYGREMSVPEQP